METVMVMSALFLVLWAGLYKFMGYASTPSTRNPEQIYDLFPHEDDTK